MKPKLLALWTKLAKDVAALSTCDRTQVGCLLLSLDGERLLGFGYNGGPRGGANEPEQDVEGGDFWIHAEANALVKPRGLEPFLLLCTHTPCVRCAGLIINSGAKRVLCLDYYRDHAGYELLYDTLPVAVMTNQDIDDYARWFA